MRGRGVTPGRRTAPPRADRAPEPAARDPIPEHRGFPAGWEQLVGEVSACTRCRLHAVRTHVVVYRGSATPRVLFVGEAPGAAEDRAGVPFVGRSGQRLDRAVATVGLTESEVGVLNLIKCRPPANRFDAEAARACRSYLDRQIDLLRPGLVVPLGAHALAALVPGAPRISDAAGAALRADGRAYFPLLHPAAALYRPAWRDRWERDLLALRHYLGSTGGP